MVNKIWLRVVNCGHDNFIDDGKLMVKVLKDFLVTFTDADGFPERAELFVFLFQV